MLPKKNPNAQLEKKRPLFFLIGISTAILFVIVAFNWTTEKKLISTSITAEVVMASIEMPRTIREKPEVKQTPKTEVNPDIINLVDDLFKDVVLLEPDLLEPDDQGETGLTDIFDEGSDEDSVEVISFILVEKVALPNSCPEGLNREQQIDCLNQWISRYLRDNIHIPRIVSEMGVSDRLMVNFVISEKGEIESVKILMGEYEDLNEEALRVMRLLPKLSPATQSNRAVKMSMNIPINFSAHR